MKLNKQADKVAYLTSIGYTLRRQPEAGACGPESHAFLTMGDRRIWVDRAGHVRELRTAERDPVELVEVF